MQHGNIAARIIEEFLSTSCGTRAPVTRDTRVVSSQQDYQLKRNAELWTSSCKTGITASLAAKAGTAAEFEDSLLSCQRYAHNAPGARFAVDLLAERRSSLPWSCVHSDQLRQVPQRVVSDLRELAREDVTFPKTLVPAFNTTFPFTETSFAIFASKVAAHASCELIRLTVVTASVVPAGIVAAVTDEAATHAQMPRRTAIILVSLIRF